MLDVGWLKLRAATAVLLLLLTAILLSVTDPRSVGSGEIKIGSHQGVEYLSDRTYTGDVTAEKGLVVNGTLRIQNCDLTMAGGFIQVNEGGHLIVESSRLHSANGSSVYYLDIRGSADIRNTTISNCLDRANHLIGIYASGNGLNITGSNMVNCGMIRLEGTAARLVNTNLSGIISYAGDIEVRGCRVDAMGVSKADGGKLDIRGTHLTSNISFSTSIASISVRNISRLSVQNVTVSGTYNAGIFSSFSGTDLSQVKIDLPFGIYGVKLDNTTIDRMIGMDISRCQIGVSLLGCSSEYPLRDLNITGSEYGLVAQGPNPLTVERGAIQDSIQGIFSYSPITAVNTTFTDMDIGVLAAGPDLLELEGCLFEDYRYWAVQQKSWDPDGFPGNQFLPASGSHGVVSFYGTFLVDVRTGKGLEVEGALVSVSSPFGSAKNLRPGEIELVWGYLDDGRLVDEVEYQISAVSGRSNTSSKFVPAEGGSLQLVLVLCDIWISSLRMEKDELVVSVISNGTDADRVTLRVDVEGSFREERSVSLPAGIVKDVSVPLDLEEGVHHIQVTATSSDEYQGQNGALMDNNVAYLEVTVLDDAGDDLLLIFLLIGMSILLFTIPILLRRKRQDG